MNNFDKLKERIEAYLANIPKDRTADVRSILADLLDYADDIENQGSNSWISVDDELPKPFEKVLVYVKTPKKVIIGTDSHNPELLEYGVRHSFVATKHEVTHWQPLPQAPKE